MAGLCIRLLFSLLALGTVNSGIKKVVIEGNLAIEDDELERVIAVSAGDIYDPSEIAKDEEALVSFYQDLGFRKTKVKSEYSWLRKRLTFSIREGKGPTVKKLKFKGNLGFPDSRLKGVIATQRRQLYLSQQVTADSLRLVMFYRNQGYEWANITPAYDSTKRRLTFLVEKGERLRVAKISIVGAPASDTSWMKRNIPLKKDKPVTVVAQQEAQMTIARYYRDRGYFYVNVSLKRREQGRDVDLLIEVTPGVRTWISSVSFSGVEPTDIHPGFLLRTTRLKPGERYSVSRVDRAARLLYATYLFNRVRVVTDTMPPKDSLDLTFLLNPAKPRIVSFGFGLETAGVDERKTSGDESDFGFLIPDRLSLSLGWEHLNLFHRGVGLASEVIFNPTFKGDYELEFNVRNRYPDILPLNLGLTISPYWKHGYYRSNADDNYHILGGEAGLERYFTDRLKAGLSMQIRRTLVGMEQDQTNFLRASLVFDSRNDFFSPTAGVYFFPYADWAGKPFGGSNYFHRAAVDFRNYLALPLDVVFAWRLHGGLIAPHSGETFEGISIYEKFTMGGAGSLRAVDYRSIGPETDTIVRIDSKGNEIKYDTTYNHYGTLMFLHSLEIRTPYISDLVGFVLFIDVGLCSQSLDEITDDEWTWGPGLGLRVKTPIGPIRLDYAKDAQTKFVSPTEHLLMGGRIDIGFLQAF
ncbi:BamA/TamA family outer membrane protein [candidate division WOR-3 bacterium]|nr:BamA/TamA family outer membrane protein [candidate division WOR-3 bacterium]